MQSYLNCGFQSIVYAPPTHPSSCSLMAIQVITSLCVLMLQPSTGSTFLNDPFCAIRTQNVASMEYCAKYVHGQHAMPLIRYLTRHLFRTHPALSAV